MIGHLLHDTLTVYRPLLAPDGRGGNTKLMNEQGTIRAKVDQPSAQERMVAAQMGATLDAIVHTFLGADVGRGDELDTGGPRRLRVMSVVNDSNRTYKRLECQVIEGG